MGLLRSRYRLHVGECIALPREVIERSCLREGDEVKVVIMRRGVLIIPEGYGRPHVRFIALEEGI